jgi:hypothetical protein
VDRAVKLLISEMPQGGPADKHTVSLEDLSRQCQSSVNGRSKVTTKDELVIRERGFVISKHNPVIPVKLSNVADVSGIPSHNHLRHLASSHVNVIACARADICLQLKAVVPQAFG